MAIICRSYNLLFIMTPRTACTAVGSVLCRELGGEYLPENDILDDKGYFRVQSKHNTLTELLENDVMTATEASSLLKFTCVRNPFDSLFSLYTKKRHKYQPLLADPDSWVHKTPKYVEDMAFCKHHSFNAWIYKHYSRKAVKGVLGMGKSSMFERFVKGVDEVMHFENLQGDFQRVLKRAGVPFELSVPVVNKTLERDREGYRKQYSSVSRKIVEYAFNDDLNRFGYRF